MGFVDTQSKISLTLVYFVLLSVNVFQSCTLLCCFVFFHSIFGGLQFQVHFGHGRIEHVHVFISL